MISMPQSATRVSLPDGSRSHLLRNMLRIPKLFNLRTDPFERADITSITYYDWLVDHVYLLVPAQAYIGEFLQTFREYPQRQKAASFNLDDVLRKLQESKHT